MLHVGMTLNSVRQKMDVTRIIIAHRPETVRSADRVIVMERGKACPPDARSVISALHYGKAMAA